MREFVSYLRVSTARQGQSGLGLEAQREAVAAYVKHVGGDLAGEFVEVESGKRADRPQLAAAMAEARGRRAILVIAKLDRLTRDTRFLLSVVEGVGDAGLAFCDFPNIPPGPIGRFLLTMLAAVAEFEAGMISQRTRSALAAAKLRGVKLGNPSLRAGSASLARQARLARRELSTLSADRIRPFIDQARAAGAVSLGDVARALQARGIRTPGGRTRWTATQVRRILK